MRRTPQGIAIHTVCTYAGHHDARSSQSYTLYAAKSDSPKTFVKVAEVDFKSSGGLSEVAIVSMNKKPLIEGVRCLRFVFGNGPLGFNVYREIAVFDRASTSK